MSTDKTFRCQLITPEAGIFNDDVRAVVLTAHDGEFGVLRNRAPLLYRLGIGQMRADTAAGERLFYIEGGFAEVADNVLTVLTEKARAAADLDAAELERLLAAPAESGDTLDIRMARHARLKAQLKVARRAVHR